MANKNIRFVAFLDVLGFSTLLKNNNIEYIHKLFSTVFQKINDKEMSGESWVARGDDCSSSSDLTMQMISDSIVIWTKDSTDLSLSILVDACNNLLYRCLVEGLPLRGAISVGNIDSIYINGDVNISSIVGDAIIYAHELEKKQKWMGCIVDKKCFSFLGAEWVHVIKGPQRKVIQYDVPCKDKYNKDITENYLVLNWCNWLYENDQYSINEMIKKSFNAHNKKIDKDDIEVKIENTTKFFIHVEKHTLFADVSIRKKY